MRTRRHFLAAAGLGSIAPLLRPFARTVFAQPGKTPTADDPSNSPILKPLAPHKKDMVVIRGLGYDGYNTPHSMGTMKALTNIDVFDKKLANVERKMMYAPSLDEVLSKSVGKGSFRPVLRIGPHWGNERGYLMFDATGKVLAPISKIDEAFAYAFGGGSGTLPVDPGAPPSADNTRLDAVRAARKSVLDLMTSEAKALQLRLPAAQKDKMTAALESILELEKGIGAGGDGASASPGASPVQCKETGQILQGITEATEAKQQQARLISSSFGCDVSRVAVWKLMGSADDGGNPFGNFHNTSHSEGRPEIDAKLTPIHNWMAQQISYLATQLKATKDPLGTGSVFDSTVIYWCNECYEGNHNPGNLPIVLVGSGGGKIETGRLFNVDKADGRNYGNLLVSLANAMGDPMKTFGDTRWCTGPLAGLLKPGVM